MKLLDDRKYVDTHEWIKPDGDLFLVGITDYAQDELGDLVFVGDFTPGTQLKAGDTAGVVESVKTASDIYAPVAGQLLAFNEALTDNPELLNTAPFDTWIFKLKPDNPADINQLLDASGYKASIG